MTCLQRYSKGWGTLSNSRGFVGNTFSEMKMCWESVPLLWKAKVDTYRNFFTTGTILLLLSAAGGLLNSKIDALFDKVARNFCKAEVACERCWHVRKSRSLEIRGSARGLWACLAFEKGVPALRFVRGRLFDLWADASSISEERLFNFFFL